jgi:hypothetical protein
MAESERGSLGPSAATETPEAPPCKRRPSYRGEAQLNSPAILTLRLLGIVSLFSLGPFLLAKLACNVSQPEPRAPFTLTTDVFARNPKAAGLELQQRVASGQFRQAAELATGDLRAELAAAELQCQTPAGPCVERRAQANQVYTRAVLLSSAGTRASVRAESRIGDQVEVVTMEVRKEGARWYVASRAPAAGTLDSPATSAEPDVSSPASAPGTADGQR